MKAYWITLCQVNDEEGYGEYIKLAGPAIEKFGGKFLARGGKQHKLCLLYTSPSPRDHQPSRMPSSG